MAVNNDNKNYDDIQDSKISKSKEEFIEKIKNRTEEWRKYIEKRMKEGETFEEASERLYKEYMKKFAEKEGLSYPIKLPHWSESKCALPNGMLRSALFGAIRKGRRRFFRRELIASIDGIQIKYTGESLDQGDLDVYEAVLHHMRSENIGELHYVTGYSLLKIMGKTMTGKNREILHTRLIRLCANALELHQGDYTYIGSLIYDVYKSRKTKEWAIVLNPNLWFLFEKNQFTLTDWNIRRKLSGQPLAQWLYSFYATHAEPFSIKIETLRELCGSETELLKHFKEKLRKALDAVVKAFKEAEQDFSYEIKDGLVYVKKQPSKSQQRYLQRKKRK